jgi:hypothetical protein
MRFPSSFKYVYAISAALWLGTVSFMAYNVHRGNSFSDKNNLVSEGDKFLFQQRSYDIGFRGHPFGILRTVFSLSAAISFEMDMDVDYLYRGQKKSQKIYGKITADRYSNITEVMLLLRGRNTASPETDVTVVRGKLKDNRFLYDIVSKEGEEKKNSGEIRLRGSYVLINPVYPFGRDLRELRHGKRASAVYNPLRNTFERINYSTTGKKADILGKQAVEIAADAMGVAYSLFLTKDGELMKVSMPSGLYIVQRPEEKPEEELSFLDVGKVMESVISEFQKKKNK